VRTSCGRQSCLQAAFQAAVFGYATNLPGFNIALKLLTKPKKVGLKPSAG
jgi:hypothetical protein